MGMDTLVRDGKPQTWIKAGSSIHTDRAIQAIAGRRITLDVPLSDSFDAKTLNAPGATLVKYEFPGRISQVGVENLRVVAPARDVPITDPQFTVLRMDAVLDSWARDIAIQETQNGIVIGSGAKRVTFERVRVVHSAPHSGAAAPADFSIAGTQILLVPKANIIPQNLQRKGSGVLVVSPLAGHPSHSPRYFSRPDWPTPGSSAIPKECQQT